MSDKSEEAKYSKTGHYIPKKIIFYDDHLMTSFHVM